jgi:hypothetical protein
MINNKELLSSRSYNYDKVNKALEIVKEYIIENNLLLYGGISIDYTLKNEGNFLYEDYILPDYDFFSYNFIEDAINIAIKLHNIGVDNVDVIGAKHLSTLRVRVDDEVVADISYLNKELFEIVDTRSIYHKQFKVINLHFILLNLIKIFSIGLLTNSPDEAIFRLEKDIKRFITVNELFMKKHKTINYMVDKTKLQSKKYHFNDFINNNLLCSEHLVLLLILKYSKIKEINDILNDINFNINDFIQIDEKNESINMLLYDNKINYFQTVLINDIKYEQNKGDFITKYVEINNVIYHDYSNYPLQYYFLEIGNNKIKCVSNTILLYFILENITFTEDNNKNQYYIHLYYIMNLIINVLERKIDKINNYTSFSFNILGQSKSVYEDLFIDQFLSKESKTKQKYMRLPKFNPSTNTKEKYLSSIDNEQINNFIKLIE